MTRVYSGRKITPNLGFFTVRVEGKAQVISCRVEEIKFNRPRVESRTRDLPNTTREHTAFVVALDAVVQDRNKVSAGVMVPGFSHMTMCAVQLLCS
jgi:hypothetical protein